MIRCDVTNEDDLKQAFESIKNEFGILNILVNNAGLSLKICFLNIQLQGTIDTMGAKSEPGCMHNNARIKGGIHL